jgi:predicted signal transduction protein with EAL and GGDEF domain
VSIGVALYPATGEDFTLMKKADTAMYHAKDAGRNTYRLFDEAMNQQVQESLRLRSNFQRGLAGEFVLHPALLDLKSGRVVGAEALVRWHDPERGMLSPGHFIPVAQRHDRAAGRLGAARGLPAGGAGGAGHPWWWR